MADDSILDKYSEIRKKIWEDLIDPMSRENFRRLHDQDPDKAQENDEFFKLCIRAESNAELQRQMALVISSTVVWSKYAKLTRRA